MGRVCEDWGVGRRPSGRKGGGGVDGEGQMGSDKNMMKLTRACFSLIRLESLSLLLQTFSRQRFFSLYHVSVKLQYCKG